MAPVPVVGVYGVVIVLEQPVAAWWFLVIWFAILGLNGWHIARMSTGVDLEVDGTVRLHRPLLGRVEPRAEQVRRIRRGRFASLLNASNSPLRLEYGNDTDGRRTAPLAWGFPRCSTSPPPCASTTPPWLSKTSRPELIPYCELGKSDVCPLQGAARLMPRTGWSTRGQGAC